MSFPTAEQEERDSVVVSSKFSVVLPLPFSGTPGTGTPVERTAQLCKRICTPGDACKGNANPPSITRTAYDKWVYKCSENLIQTHSHMHNIKRLHMVLWG